MSMPTCHAVWATALILGAAMRLCGREAPVNTTPVNLPTSPNAAANGLPVVLEEFPVIIRRPALESAHWNYCRIEGLEILSSAPERASRQLAADFNEFVFALDLLSPQLRLHDSLPVTMVICGDIAHFRELSAGTSQQGGGSLTRYYYGPDRSVILLNAQMQLLQRADGTTEMESEADARFRRLYSERARGDYMRFLLGRMRPALPQWFQQGAAELYAKMRILDGSITVGQAPVPYFAGSVPSVSGWSGGRPRTLAGSPRPQPDNFHYSNPPRWTPPGGDYLPSERDTLLPLKELFAPRRPNTPASGLWLRECEAFVHWGIHGDYGRHAKQLFTFVERSRHEPPSEALFRECFQMSYAEGGQALRTHTEFTRTQYFGIHAGKGKKLPRPDPVLMRAATNSEIARLKAEVHELAGRPEEARQELYRAYRNGESDPELLAALGLSDGQCGEMARARQFLEAAAARHARQPRAHLALARLRLMEYLAQRSHPEEKLAPHQTKSVLEPIVTALAAAPIIEGYSLAAETWLASEIRPTPAQLRGLVSGAQLAPTEHELVYRVTTLAAICRDELARPLIALGVKYATSNEQRRRFEALAGQYYGTPTIPNRG